MVDAAANLRPFLTKKNRDGMAATKKQDAPPAPATTPAEGGTPAAKQGLTLTTAARDSLVVGLTDSLEKLTGLAQAAGEATIDDAAPASPEVGELLKQCAEVLMALAGDSVPAADPPAPPAAEPVAAAAKDDSVAKAGKKISASNLKALKTAMDAIKGVLDAAEPDTSKTKKADETDDDVDADHRAKVHKMLEGFGERLAKSDTEQAKRDELIVKSLQNKDAIIAAGTAAIAKAKGQIAELAKRANSPGGGNAGSSEGDGGDGGEPVAKNKGNSWGDFDRRANLIGHEQQESAGR